MVLKRSLRPLAVTADKRAASTLSADLLLPQATEQAMADVKEGGLQRWCMAWLNRNDMVMLDGHKQGDGSAVPAP